MTRRLNLLSSKPIAEEPVINLTPLIDVVFVILIMFIVIAPLLELDQIDLADAPGNRADKAISVQESSPITIHVRKDNTVWVNQNKMTLDQLRDYLVKARRQYPQAKPQLFHDRQAHFGTYQSVKNIAEEAGFEQLEIILKPA